MPDSKYVPALDGVRGAAALLVVIHHLPDVGFASIPGTGGALGSLFGVLGVLLFFTLSGFLMGHLYLAERPDAKAVNRFLIARAARVLPFYMIVVTASYLASLILGPAFVFYLTGPQFLRQIALVGGQHVFWTIPPEVEFYVLFAMGWWMLYNGWLIKAAPALIGVLALILFFKPVLPGCVVFSQIHIFVIGVLAAVMRRHMTFDLWTIRLALAVQAIGALLIALVLTGVVPIPSGLLAPHKFPAESFYSSFPICLMFGAVILAYSVPTGFANALFANPAARQLGACSFSLYLLHEPVMAGIRPLLFALHLPPAVSIILAVAAALGAAMLSHRYLERPLQRLSRDRMTDWVNHVWPTHALRQAAKV